MLRYDIVANLVLDIKINNGYSVVPFVSWDREKDCYFANFYLRRHGIDKLDMIDDSEYMHVQFTSDVKSIKMNITKYVSELNSNKVFEKYMNRNEYELKCFNKGNDFYSQTSK